MLSLFDCNVPTPQLKCYDWLLLCTSATRVTWAYVATLLAVHCLLLACFCLVIPQQTNDPFMNGPTRCCFFIIIFFVQIKIHLSDAMDVILMIVVHTVKRFLSVCPLWTDVRQFMNPWHTVSVIDATILYTKWRHKMIKNSILYLLLFR